MKRCTRPLVGGVMILTALGAGVCGATAQSVPTTDAAWRQLWDRLQGNPYYLAAMDRDSALAIVEAGVRRGNALWAAYGSGICTVRANDRHDPPDAVRREAFRWSGACTQRILDALAASSSTAPEMIRSDLVSERAEALVELDSLAGADSLAVASLRPGGSPTDPMYGNVVYAMNEIRGRVALRRGDHDAAVAYLRRAGQTEGSPQLNSFGPHFTLARELLEAGETDAVLSFLDDVARFWNNPRALAELAEARKTIVAGQIPSGRRWH